MAQKILVCCTGSLTDYESKKKALATTLGVCPDDVVFLPGGVSVSVVDIPDEMIKGREKADKEAEKEAEKAEKAQQEAETEQHKIEIEAIRVSTAEAAKNAPPPAVDAKTMAERAQHTQNVTKSAADKAPPDYETWTLDELHTEAAKRNLQGRAGLNKADTVKLIQKDDKAKAGK